MMSKVLFLVGLGAMLTIALIAAFAFVVSLLDLNDSISDFIELTDSEFMRYIAIISVTSLITYLVFLRFTLAICARTIGKRIGLLTSWRLTEKNTFRMFLCFMTVLVPAISFSIAVTYFYQVVFGIDLFYSGEILSTMSYVHIFILAPIITLPLSAMCSQCASFYRHCGGEECTQDT